MHVADLASRARAQLFVGDAELDDEWHGEDFGLQDGTTLTAVVRTEQPASFWFLEGSAEWAKVEAIKVEAKPRRRVAAP